MCGGVGVSAATRVAHAAETIRARWERGVASDPQTEAAQALEDTCQLLDPEVAASLRAMQKGLVRALDRVSELEAERHTTNEALSDAAEQLRVNRDRITQLETAPLAWADRLDAKSLDNLLISLGSATEHEPMDEAIEQIHLILAGFREAALDLPVQTAPELVVYRAEYESMVFGLYTTPAAAREHCEAYERRDQPTAELDWIEDEEDGVAELVATVDGSEKPTGYVVTALEVASAYDPDADE